MKYFFSISLVLGLMLFFSCGKEEPNPKLEPTITSYEVSIDGQNMETSDFRGRISRGGNGFSTNFSNSVGDDYYFNLYFYRKLKFISPGTYTSTNDTLSGDVHNLENGNKFWYTSKKSHKTLTISEVTRESDKLSFISGSLTFEADSIPQRNGNSATGSKHVSATFKNIPLHLVGSENPNFTATINQKPWIGDAYIDWPGLSNNFNVKAYNQWGDLITLYYPQKITQIGTYTSNSASYRKRMQDGSYQIWQVNSGSSNPTYTITIDKVNGELISGKATFTAEPVTGSSTTTPVTVDVVFKDIEGVYR